MRNSFFVIAFAVLTSLSVYADIPADYYNTADGKKGEDLRKALNKCISSHTTLNYDALEEYYIPTDFRPDGTLWDIYSTCEFTMAKANVAQKKFCDGWNKEHTVPSSWFNKQSPMYSDIIHVLPTDARVNNLRGNDAYGETNSRTDEVSQSEYALGHIGSSVDGIGKVYQPDNRYMGDLARIYFYMVTCYISKDFTNQSGSKMFTYTNSVNQLSDYSVKLLMKWHHNDPVSSKEINRNDSVYKYQKNRNPFVDYPELADYIWGDKKTENFNLSTALSAYSKDYVPLDTEGSEQADYEKFGVNWFVNGVKIGTDSVFKNHKPSSLPEVPVSCSATSNTFVGWSSAAIAGLAQTAPEDLFTTPVGSPTIKENRTFYAVFAHEEQGTGAGSVTETADFSTGYKSGTAVTSVNIGKVTVTFAKGTNSNAPKVYSELRCYGGNTMTFSGATITRIEFMPGKAGGTNALKANTGKLTDGYIWTGEASTIVFTVDGESGNRGIGSISVTYDDNTTVFEYSDYLTSCGGTTEVEQSEVSRQQSDVRKFIRDGKLYIEANGVIYDIFGRIYE